MGILKKVASGALFMLFLCGTSSAEENMGVACTAMKNSTDHLKCDLRLFSLDGKAEGVPKNGVTQKDISVHFGAKEKIDLAEGAYTPYKQENHKTAVLFLVDTSDPRRKQALNNVRDFLKQAIKDAPENVELGVLGFDAELEVNPELPIGSSKDKLQAAVEKLKAKGSTTELYRSARDAIKYLARSAKDADRKALVLLSDGKPEDTEYTSDQVVELARKENVVIYGVALLDKKDATDRQALMKLAEETSGPYSQVNVQEGFLRYSDVFYTYINNGGFLELDVSDIYGEQELTFKVVIDEGKGVQKTYKGFYSVDRPLLSSVRWWEKYAKYIVAVIGGLLFGFVLWLLVRKRKVLYATLKTLDSTPVEYKICSPIARVGRNKKCEIQIDNDSVSSFHASIKYTREGEFLINDLGSLNGTLIDEEDADGVILSTGTIITLGDVRLEFTEVRRGEGAATLTDNNAQESIENNV